jgi:16S rRNA (guanine1207-N2)-methyltransferase
MTQVFGTKSKEETYARIASAWDGGDVGMDITIIKPNDLGGKTLEKTLVKEFPNAQTDSRNKSRIITLTKTENTPPIINEWNKLTTLSMVESTGYYSMPGLFGWDKIDMGSKLLIETVTNLKGIGADFGCGYGYITRECLARFNDIKSFHALDIDPRAVSAVQKNVDDARMHAMQADCTNRILNLPPLDFVISNPPFHRGKNSLRRPINHYANVAICGWWQTHTCRTRKY